MKRGKNIKPKEPGSAFSEYQERPLKPAAAKKASAKPAPRRAKPAAPKTEEEINQAAEEILDSIYEDPTENKPKPATPKNSKRGPGRPRKVNVNQNVQIGGILDKPAVEGDIVEMSYHSPIIIKKIFSALNAYGVTEVDLLFDNVGLHIRTPCRLKKNIICCDIEGSCMIGYYCSEPICVTISLENIKQAMYLTNKNHDRLMFFIKESNRDKLFLILQEPIYNVKSTYTIAVSGVGSLDLLQRFKEDETNYPVHFTYQSAELKRVITGINKSQKNVISFAKEGSGDIQMALPDGRSFSGTMVLPVDKFKIESTLAEDDIIHVSVLGANIKSFTDAAIGDAVTIYLDAEKNLCLSSREDLRGGKWGVLYRVFVSPVVEQNTVQK